MREALFTKSLTVSLPQDVYAQIKIVTDERRVSMAQWVREVAMDALSHYDTNEEKGGE